MKLILDIEDPDSLRDVVTQDLKEIGIKLPKHKKSKTKEDVLDADGGVFGTRLRQVPCLSIDNFGMVPRFLVEATAVLEKHLDMEGIFRKSGSVARQKELKDRIELGQELKDGHPYDVASLVKQFFRELPDPLLTAKMHDTFLKVNALETEGQRHTGLMLLCLLLPLPHLTTLRYIMCFLSRVAKQSSNNKMDTPNLAVCMAPNLMHNNPKAEKMNSESKLLHAQTNIVHLLICHAQEIGGVPDDLYERTCLYSCFQSEDELERSEDMNDSKRVKKKKKRSGSLQGLVNNLSHSFSKWRKDGRGHNSSSVSEKSSMMSYTSYDQVDVTVTSHTSDELTPDLQNVMLSDVTPKVMRKRKASGEMVPFSASKKKAILQNMPQMATLGNTPFTPVQKRPGQGLITPTTPSIHFAEGFSGPLTFNATPTTGGPEGLTPRRRIDKLLSPGSATKVKRHTTAKSGCFSPKTSKSGKRKSFKGFLRRLSGGKDQPASATAPDLSTSGDVGKRLAYPGCPPEQLIILPPEGDGKKKGGIFRRKTPSSPARLLPGDNPDCADRPSEMEMDERTHLLRHHKRGFSSDGGALKRGRPNTVAVGLPVPNRRSLDRSLPVPIRHSSQKDMNVSPPIEGPGALDTSPIAKMGPFLHDLSRSCSPIPGTGHDECGDTSISPEVDVLLSEPRGTESARLNKHPSSSSVGLDEADIADTDQSNESMDKAFIQDSTMMGDSAEDTHGTISDSTEQNHMSAEEAALLVGDDFKKPQKVNVPRKREVTDTTESCKPPGDTHNASSKGDHSLEEESLNVTNFSVTSESSVCTVIYNGKPVISRNEENQRAVPPLLKPRNSTQQTKERLSEQKADDGVCDKKGATDIAAESDKSRKFSDMTSKPSINKSASSLDSGIDQMDEFDDNKNKSKSATSLDSGFGVDDSTSGGEKSGSSGVKSVDSGLDCEVQSNRTDAMLKKSTMVDDAISPILEEAGAVSAFSRNVARAQSFRASKEGAAPVLLKRGESFRAPSSLTKGHPGSGEKLTMPVSAEMHHMLARVGVVGKQPSRNTKTNAPFVALPTEDTTAMQEKEGSASVRESVLNLQHAGVVSSNVKELSSKLDQEVADKRASPLRFTNTVTRNRGVSPVRIPTIFAKADSEAQKYKDMVKKSLLKSPAKFSGAEGADSSTGASHTSSTTATSGSKGKPILPISTNLLRNDSIESAKKRLGVGVVGDPTNSVSLSENASGLVSLNPPRNDSIECANKRWGVTQRASQQSENTYPDEFESPANAFSAKVQNIDINQSLLETIEQCCTPTSERLRKSDFEMVEEEMAALKDSTNAGDTDVTVANTPRIKNHLMNKDIRNKLLAKGLNTPRVRAGETSKRVRSPVKPVKRLQGSPRSPRASAKASKSPIKFNMSPGKVTKRGTLSPIPNHVSDWNI